MRNGLCLLLFTLALTIPAVASADPSSEWATTFQPAAAASHVPAGELQIIVVAAGAASPELRAVTDAFTEALRRSGRSGTVLDDSSLSEVGTIDDAKVLSRVRALPVTHVAIVRLLPGNPAKALVTVYEKNDRDPVDSFIATSGVAISPGTPRDEGEPGNGVSSEAVEGVDELQEDSESEVEDAKERYEAAYVGYDGFDITITGGSGWASAKVSTRFYLGASKQPLQGADFYKAVGRDDLAESYEQRSTTRVALIVGGIGLSVASLYPFSQMETGGCGFGSSGDSACQERQDSHNDDMLTAGTVLLAVGSLGATIGFMMDPHPVSDSEQRGLADTHNEELKDGLHLDTRAKKSRAYAWAVAPAVGPGFGGVAFALRF